MLVRFSLEQVLANFPEEEAWLRGALQDDLNQTGEVIRKISRVKQKDPLWFLKFDRKNWQYWLAFRDYLIKNKHWSMSAVQLLDRTSDEALAELAPPSNEQFDIRGLVVGYVQSGKTSHYTALLAKAADCGYRFCVVFSGMDKGLRRQTQTRLDRELTGLPNHESSVSFPPIGMQWHKFTDASIEGDFKAVNVNQAALQGSQPVLMVVKKNGDVLRALNRWLDSSPKELLQKLPAIFIDDEADQASIDSRGTYATEDNFQEIEKYDDPAPINSLIREALTKFDRKCYVAYTATPYANILIPPDKFDPEVSHDLYPRDFIFPLPKPAGYYGAEEFFGDFENFDELSAGDLNFIRITDLTGVAAGDPDELLSFSLKEAIKVFILGGAIRSFRGHGEKPCSMLIHTSHRKDEHSAMLSVVQSEVSSLINEWHYGLDSSLKKQFEEIFQREFRDRSAEHERQGHSIPTYEELLPFLAQFLTEIGRDRGVRIINSESGEILDYENEPSLKVIAIGGNKLSRGLTLEGLLVTYFDRRSKQYDTLFQMGRWFGFIGDYYDLVRVYTNAERAEWFYDLARIESKFRSELSVYARNPNIIPAQVRPKIALHSVMKPTSPQKRRFASTVSGTPVFAGQLEQTIVFPLSNVDIGERLTIQERCREAAKELVISLGQPRQCEIVRHALVFPDCDASNVVNFLTKYDQLPEITSFPKDEIIKYIREVVPHGDLARWTVAISGLSEHSNFLGSPNWIPESFPLVSSVERTRRGENSNNIGALRNKGDEQIGLRHEQVLEIDDLISKAKERSRDVAARRVRKADNGLLILYPISRYSGYDEKTKTRKIKTYKGNQTDRYPLFSWEDIDNGNARDLVGVAISFPQASNVELYAQYLTVKGG